MAGMEKTFRLVLDADTKAAVSGLDGFSSAAKKADSATAGAAKGVGSSMDGIASKTSMSEKAMSKFGISSGAMSTAVTGAAVAGAGALAHFALEGAAHFADLGVAVDKFSTVSGVGNEAASKWIAVADDFGISTDTLQGSMGKLAKTLGTNVDALAQYGIAVAKSKDGTVDMQATMMNVIDAYNATKDPAAKAALGSAAFGKSYADLIPLITKGSASIKASFDEVSSAQTFDDGGKKVQAAKDYKAAMDNLHDAVGDLQMTLGQKLIPALVKVADGASKASAAFIWLGDHMPSEAMQAFNSLLNPIAAGLGMLDDKVLSVGDRMAHFDETATPFDRWLQDHSSWLPNFAGEADVVVSGIGKVNAATALTAPVLTGVQIGLAGIVTHTDDAAAAAQRYKDEAAAMSAAVVGQLAEIEYKWMELTGTFTDDQAIVNLRTGFDNVKQAGTDAFDAIKKHSADAEQKNRDYQIATDDLALKVINYGKDVLALPLSRVTELTAEVRAGDIQRVEDQLDILTRNRTMSIDIVAKGGAGYGAISGARASGGPVRGGSSYLVGENGPEMLTMGASGYVTPNSMLSGGGGTGTVNNVYVSADATADPVAIGQAIAEKLRAFERTSGPGWRN